MGASPAERHCRYDENARKPDDPGLSSAPFPPSRQASGKRRSLTGGAPHLQPACPKTVNGL